MGTRLYTAPEVLNKHRYDSQIDIWGATVVLYVMLCGRFPFKGKNFTEVKKSINETDLDHELSRYSRMSQEAKDFLKMGLQIDPKKRANCQEMLNSAFLRDCSKLSCGHDVHVSNSEQESLFLLRAGHLIQEE